ncbi:hypothetical protein PAHAL_9G087400 [Panicum hallii]|uniref:Uncharacterized protein n=1 Tax=Panicum hallii TaxID=206008 RepID=A0A2S3II10_9POAL|nr:hypothetical protein PAHAL_9G087400 [Panicum hallii]
MRRPPGRLSVAALGAGGMTRRRWCHVRCGARRAGGDGWRTFQKAQCSCRRVAWRLNVPARALVNRQHFTWNLEVLYVACRLWRTGGTPAP